jgi:hypothetical protein
LVNKKHFNGFSKLDIRQQNSEGQFPEASLPNSIFTKKIYSCFSYSTAVLNKICKLVNILKEASGLFETFLA